jgi:hypothetical protein
VGLSRGLLSSWSPRFRDLSTSLISYDIVVELVDNFLNCMFRLINVHGLYADWCNLWIRLSGSSFLNSYNIIFGGDLNFTLSLREVWGGLPRQDPWNFFFPHWIKKII